MFSDGKRMLQRLIEGRWLSASGVIGLWPANTVNDDDIEIYTDESRSEVLLTWSRRCACRASGRWSTACSGRTAASPTSSRRKVGKPDYVGLFAVTAGLGIDKKEQQFLADHDDYSSIMLKALADRLAEAFAERLHQRVRTEFWGLRA